MMTVMVVCLYSVSTVLMSKDGRLKDLSVSSRYVYMVDFVVCFLLV